MPYDAMPLLCRRCLDARVPEGELIAYLDRYVSELPESVRASEDVYLSRLRRCAECAHLHQATCVLCGCYVQARAAKRNQRCPLPGAPRWTEEPTPPNEGV